MATKTIEELDLSEEQVRGVRELIDNARRGYVPKERLDEALERTRKAETELNESRDKLAKAVENEKLVEQLSEELKNTKEGYESEKINSKKLEKIKAFYGDKTHDLDLLSSLIDLSKVTVTQEGNVTGLEEQIKPLQEAKPYLWKEPGQAIRKSEGTAAKSGETKSLAKELAEKKLALSKQAEGQDKFFQTNR